jgi:RNA polymerase sigma-70 factor (ECF subfamily)
MIGDDLIARCGRGEPRAQHELYKALYGLMMSVCSRYERNRQDAVARMNQGFLKVLTNIDKRRPEVPFELWVRRIMINTVIDEYRKESHRRTQETLDVHLDTSIQAEVNDYLRHMEADAFAALLDQVPMMSRKVFNLFAIDGYAHAEIADLLGISEGTSKWHVSHARQVLQQAIGQLAGRSLKTELK